MAKTWQKQILINRYWISFINYQQYDTSTLMFITAFFHSHCYHPPRFSKEFCFSSKEHPGSGHLETKHQDLLFHLPGQVLMGGAGGFGVWSGVLCYESLSKVVRNLTQPDVKNNDDNGAVKCKQAYLDLLKRQRLKLDQIGRTGGQLECINKIK